MAFNRLAPEDFVISSDSITATLWSEGAVALTNFNTSSTQEAGTSGDFYLNVFQTGSTLDSAAVQFAIAYGNRYASGSAFYNNGVTTASPTRTTYGQYRNLILGDENAQFVFGTATSSDFWVINIDRTRYKESLLPGSLTLILSASGKLSLTDDSQISSTVIFNDAGRVYQLISGSAGVVATG